jgi:hypothetical protein
MKKALVIVGDVYLFFGAITIPMTIAVIGYLLEWLLK